MNIHEYQKVEKEQNNEVDELKYYQEKGTE